jgi:hypothetical protein
MCAFFLQTERIALVRSSCLLPDCEQSTLRGVLSTSGILSIKAANSSATQSGDLYESRFRRKDRKAVACRARRKSEAGLKRFRF